MFALDRRTLLLAALLTAACVPAQSAELVNDGVQMALVDAERLAAAQPGPVIARESLSTETVASVATVGSGHPTRGTLNVAGRAATPAAPRSYAAYGPAGHPLMLGIGY
jgi:hypothetical protein